MGLTATVGMRVGMKLAVASNRREANRGGLMLGNGGTWEVVDDVCCCFDSLVRTTGGADGGGGVRTAKLENWGFIWVIWLPDALVKVHSFIK